MLLTWAHREYKLTVFYSVRFTILYMYIWLIVLEMILANFSSYYSYDNRFAGARFSFDLIAKRFGNFSILVVWG